MVKSGFQEIANEENGNYQSIDKNYFGRGMSKTPVTKHKLKLIYRKHVIEILYELGNFNLAKITCEFSKETEIPFFEIKIKSHLRRLFNKSLNILTIKSEDDRFENYLQEQINVLGLEQIGIDNLFHPKIFTEKSIESLCLITEYHLEFGDKIKVIRPMIRFYESIIDFTLDKY